MIAARPLRWALPLLVGCAATPLAHAGAYVFAENNGVNIITHPQGYFGSGGVVNVEVCVNPASSSATSLEQSTRNIVATFNRMIPDVGNLRTGLIGGGEVDWESVTLHEVGHCLGLAHPNLASESGLSDPDRNYTKTRLGANGSYDLGIGSDGVRGSADDLRGDDENLHWFARADNDPFTLLNVPSFDALGYSRLLGELPGSDAFPANGDRSVAPLYGAANTEAVMQQGSFGGELQRTLTADDVGTLRLAMSGLDEVEGTADDYTVALTYGGVKSGCDINITHDPTYGGFAVCNLNGSFLSATHVRITSAEISVNPNFNWVFSTTDNDLNGLSGQVWLDADGNGIRGAEAAAASVTVTLYPSGDPQRSFASTQTAVDGSYSFANVPDGTHILEVTPGESWQALTLADQGADDGVDSDVAAGDGRNTSAYYDGSSIVLDAGLISLADFGDAPASYPTLLAANGALHAGNGSLTLGSNFDTEFDGQPTAQADGDEGVGTLDDDGVSFGGNLSVGESRSLTVTASAAALLDAWVDFNADGDWEDAGEQVFASRAVVGGANALAFTVPAGATAGSTYGRFRLSSAGGLAPGGAAADGEVEDYLLTIEAGADADGDSVPDDEDNCPAVSNADQTDTDADTLGDACDPDDDNDGMTDAYETDNGLNPLDDSDAGGDADGDGLTNLEEAQAGTRADTVDSDADGLHDGLDNAPAVASNLCSGAAASLGGQTVASGSIAQCGASASVRLLSTLVVESGGTLEVLSPVLRFDPGSGLPAGALLQVRALDPSQP